jgi:hypothetical protein
MKGEKSTEKALAVQVVCMFSETWNRGKASSASPEQNSGVMIFIAHGTDTDRFRCLDLRVPRNVSILVLDSVMIHAGTGGCCNAI